MKFLWIWFVPYLVSPITWATLVFGLCIGSFLNVCILRIPEGTFFRHSRSVCPNCGVGIPFYLNIPVLSYLWLRGRAACCNVKISIQYPLVEIGTGILFVLLYWYNPFLAKVGIDWQIQDANLIRFLHAALFACLLIVSAVIDIHLMIIPNVITYSMIALTPLVVYVHPDLTLQSSLIGLVAGGLSLYAIAWSYWLIRREVGLGMGDVKLLAAIGAWMGYQAVAPTIFIGSILGALFGLVAMILLRKLTLKSAIPFGPFIALGALLYLLWGNFIQDWFILKR